MKELLEKYREMFDEQFPLMLFRSSFDEEVIKAIEKCISENKPFEMDFEDADY